MVTATSIWSSEVWTRGAGAEAGDGVGDALSELLLGGVGVAGVDRLGVVEHEVDHQLRAEGLDELGLAPQAAIGGASVAMAASSKSSGRMPGITRWSL